MTVPHPLDAYKTTYKRRPSSGLDRRGGIRNWQVEPCAITQSASHVLLNPRRVYTRLDGYDGAVESKRNCRIHARPCRLLVSLTQ